MNRRRFLRNSLALSMTPVLPLFPRSLAAAGASAPNNRIAIAVAGVRGRGASLLRAFAARNDVEVRYVCDLDPRVLEERASATEKITGNRPRTIVDFRRALDDRAVDALVLGTPDHWHAIPTIMACQAGKDVYTEKPDGHNAVEGRTMVAAGRKYARVIQLGTQARSGAMQQRAMEFIRNGSIGKVRFAKAWESARQGAIPAVPDSAPPKGVDYDLWLGPAPKRPFNRNRFHGSWRWFFDYGTGDLGNDGVHRLDVARWALDSALHAEGKTLPTFPQSISAHGGKYYFDDVQEWPDTLMVTYDYGGYLLTYEMRVWTPYPLHGESEGAAICGDQGVVVIGNSSWRVFNGKEELVSEEHGGATDEDHVGNFLDCMRSRSRPSADLETIGHPSSLLCHLGNAAWRAGRALKFDMRNYRCIGDDDANQYLRRPTYREPWLLPAIDKI